MALPSPSSTLLKADYNPIPLHLPLTFHTSSIPIVPLSMVAIQNLEVILKNPLNHAEFLLVKHTCPNRFGEEEYDSFMGSELWDLPSTRLNLWEEESESQIIVVAKGYKEGERVGFALKEQNVAQFKAVTTPNSNSNAALLICWEIRWTILI
ncbi:hypothetical protein F2P56_008398 [Juglans regia]|uniref:Uncharacterized protein n=1 Tax=Juglans regia TaxID=51240 RepID=A0A833XUZ5_JUGRE|nr:hypothetical protein F2P56_008398 [Juglans regia]